MRAVHLVRGGVSGRQAPAFAQLDRLSAALARKFRAACHVDAAMFDIGFAEDVERSQYYSSAILAALPEPSAGEVVLLVTEADLFVPVLTFVFGEAQLGGARAIVSMRRLRESYYGQPPNVELESLRLAKEALHEIGHTQGLRHCDNWRCVMSSSHAVERLDLKESAFCPRCAPRALGA